MTVYYRFKASENMSDNYKQAILRKTGGDFILDINENEKRHFKVYTS